MHLYTSDSQRGLPVHGNNTLATPSRRSLFSRSISRCSTGDKQSSLNMNAFFALVTLLIAAGVVSGYKRVEVERGEKKVVVVENKSGLDIRRLTLYGASDCDNPKIDDICYRYCSPGEKADGCNVTNKNCSKLFIETKDSVSYVTPLHASDGCYVAQVIFNNSKEEKVLIVVNGELPVGIPVVIAVGIPVVIAVGIKVGIPVGIPVGIKVGIPVVLITVGIAVGIAAWWCCLKKKKNESKARDCKKDPKRTSLKESNIKAGEQTAGDSFKMADGDRISCSEDDNLKEVLIHSGDDDNSKHNNTNNYDDSNFFSNEDDDVILSNNTNNYVNNDVVANGKNDVISTGHSSNDYL